MVWLLIIVIVGLVFAPAMWLRPSPGQKRVGLLRESAIRAGVAVRLQKPPLHATGVMPAYRWAYPAQRPGPNFVLVRASAASATLKAFVAGWQWRIEPLRPLPAAAAERLAAVLETLPEDAVVLESGPEALTLWWEESLDAEGFAPCQVRLAALRDALAGRPDRPGTQLPRQVPFG